MLHLRAYNHNINTRPRTEETEGRIILAESNQRNRTVWGNQGQWKQTSGGKTENKRNWVRLNRELNQNRTDMCQLVTLK